MNAHDLVQEIIERKGKIEKDVYKRQGFHFDEIPDLSGSNEPAIWEALVPDDVQLRERLRVEYKQVYSPDQIGRAHV